MNTIIILFIHLSLGNTYNIPRETDFKDILQLQDSLNNLKADTTIVHAVIKNHIQIPILCYHNIHERTSKNSPLLTLSESEFNAQLQSLFDSGYHTVSPDQLYQYLTEGITLPSKSMLLTFDDSHEEDYLVAEPVMERYGFKGVFFITTGYIDKKNYLTTNEVKQLSENGNVIAAHSWNHPDFTMSKNIDWRRQLYFPKQQLQKITGKPVYYFAYPFGSWNFRAVDSVKYYGYNAAFQLKDKQNKKEPLFTIRRIMVSGKWSPVTLQSIMKKEFN